ncbi:MAG: hypothetical protein MZW92_79495 [Comamonadaceae bacterium]|nr:hypothetical protein [Comamonadaceae bacterium]
MAARRSARRPSARRGAERHRAGSGQAGARRWTTTRPALDRAGKPARCPGALPQRRDPGRDEPPRRSRRGLRADSPRTIPELPGALQQPGSDLRRSRASYDKARAAAAKRRSARAPDYATAHENLGDVYACAMAAEAYDKALQLDPGNAALRAKLQLARERSRCQAACQPLTPAAAHRHVRPIPLKQ